MATDSSTFPQANTRSSTTNLDAVAGVIKRILSPFASLRLTVALFAMSVFLILVGTLAQVEKDMWQVMEDYFHCTFAWIDLQIFFPRSWFPNLIGKVPGGFWFPGGFLIGTVMVINLLSAHLVRFKVQAKGSELFLGFSVMALGGVLTYVVIASGHNSEGLQGEPFFSWQSMWLLIKSSLAVAGIACGIAVAIRPQLTQGQRLTLLSGAIVCGGAAVWLFARGAEAMPSPSALRILWQLLQATFAAVVVGIGCLFAFKKRAGVVVLHLGIGLIMFSEFFVSQYAVEGRLTMREGETVNYVKDIREVELAVIDRSPAESDKVVAIPGTKLRDGASISTDPLPFDLRVVEFMKNSKIVAIDPDQSNPATKGIGTKAMAKEVRPVSGTEGGRVDEASAYVELLSKDNGESLGVYLLSQRSAFLEDPEVVEIDGKSYHLYLRFKRDYKPYAMALIDVRKDDYLGTSTPMNYSSDVRLVDSRNNEERDFKIWMNNPLRYAGETFYQSGYNVDMQGREITDLQVVTNTGWMMPYVGCMFVTVGMLFHFSLALVRFQGRQQRESDKADNSETGGLNQFTWWRAANVAVPLVVVLLFGGYAVSKFRVPSEQFAGMRIHEFGKLPVIFEGRAKPLDTLARNSLRIVSNREVFVDENDQKQPAILWLIDVISGSPASREHQVVRIDNLNVLEFLGLERRKGFRYSEQEINPSIEKLQAEIQKVRELPAEELSVYQRKLLELERRLRRVRLLQSAFTPIPYPEFPTMEEIQSESPEVRERMSELAMMVRETPRIHQMLERMEPPRVVPVKGEGDWKPYAIAWNEAYLGRLRGDDPSAATITWTKILSSYLEGNAKEFNTTVTDYKVNLVDEPPAELADAKVDFEYFFNHAQPFLYSTVLYIAAFCFVCLAWLLSSFGLFPMMNRTATGLLIATLLLHTYALGARIVISGRPPVTNLYSSAVFIGWGCVILGLIFERIYRLGIGNAVAAISGFSTLMIAYALAADGDTFTVLQAVLDTQFWLATHVVCVTLGYSATFVAGLIGAIYLLSLAGRRPTISKSLASMMYGTLCFAIFFSFFGTVLGGLWADDSWGRFWGWDPKENGALMIVLWNALILHARWGGMVKARGIAMLAVLGNIVTAWSWFGVNELGVGLHSYGFTEGVLRNLILFGLSQLLIVAFGLAVAFLGLDQARKNQVKAST